MSGAGGAIAGVIATSCSGVAGAPVRLRSQNTSLETVCGELKRVAGWATCLSGKVGKAGKAVGNGVVHPGCSAGQAVRRSLTLWITTARRPKSRKGALAAHRQARVEWVITRRSTGVIMAASPGQE